MGVYGESRLGNVRVEVNNNVTVGDNGLGVVALSSAGNVDLVATGNISVGQSTSLSSYGVAVVGGAGKNLTVALGNVTVSRGVDANGGRNYAGVYAAFGQVSASVDHLGHGKAGTNDMDAYTFGAYWTHYGASGWYVDAVGQVSRYDLTAKPSRDVRGLDTNGTGYAASLEAGYPINAGGMVVEPQVQLVYQSISFDDGTDQGARVSYSDVDSLAARVGVRLSRTWQTAQQRNITAWLRPSVWQEFMGDTRTRISTLSGAQAEQFGSDIGGTTGEITAGLSAELAQNWMLFANVGYRAAFSEANSYAVYGKLGLRLAW